MMSAISAQRTSIEVSYTLLQKGCSICIINSRKSESDACIGGGGNGGGVGGGGLGGGAGGGEGGGAGGGPVSRYWVQKSLFTMNSRAVINRVQLDNRRDGRDACPFCVRLWYSAQVGRNARKYCLVTMPAPFVVRLSPTPSDVT